ncbi:MAG: hypothetical protein GY806_21730 [Gammaproteobacteria bacterium]|nr:hypothetical protein [Gammaproteobacteria bacterium]
MSVTITSLVRGSTIPQTKTFPETVRNIDFEVIGNKEATNTGDGNDERTDWVLNFTTHDSYSSFSTSHKLKFARLTLMLEPKNALIVTDLVEIDGLPQIATPVIQTLPVDGRVHTVTIELLDYYCSANILEILVKHAGKIPMKYRDDAIISYAHLELSHAC